MKNNKCFSELVLLPTFKERFEYLKTNSIIGEETFGSRRMINQQLYNDKTWKRLRNEIAYRDNWCDLGVDGLDIRQHFVIHHINPITYDDIVRRHPKVFDSENLITTTPNTHRAIHYGSIDDLYLMTNRKPNDTKLW